jgi:hypothetical protein
MSFSSAFAGSHRITGESWSASGADTGAIPLGTWNVPTSTLAVSGPGWLSPGALGVGYPPTTVTATGGTGSYTWSETGLPGGLSIAPGTGTITGTPATDAGSPFQVEVTVTDSNSAAAQASFTLTVSTFSPCDVNQDGRTNAADWQMVINEALGVIPAVHDLNKDGLVNLADAEVVANAVLGSGCLAR